MFFEMLRPVFGKFLSGLWRPIFWRFRSGVRRLIFGKFLDGSWEGHLRGSVKLHFRGTVF